MTLKFVGAIIENQKGEILLQKRDRNAPSFKNCWTLFGGKVEKEESPRKAILRELKEEISLVPNKIPECKLIQNNIQDNSSQQFIFLVRTNAKVSQLKLKEGAEMKFVNRKNLFKRKFAFNIKEILETFINTKEINLIIKRRI